MVLIQSLFQKFSPYILKISSRTIQDIEIGSTIWIETLRGKENFTVLSKPSHSRSSEFVYILLNEQKKKSNLDLKEESWDYVNGDSKNHRVIMHTSDSK